MMNMDFKSIITLEVPHITIKKTQTNITGYDFIAMSTDLPVR